MASKPPKVFISYSHDSAEHTRRVRALADRLRADGIEAWIDQYVQDPDEGWIRWMRGQVKQADRVLLVFTETYQRRFERDEEEGMGFGATFEGVIVTQALYEIGGHNAKFRPVVFHEGDERFISLELRRFNRYRVDTPENYEALLRWLHETPRVIAPEFRVPSVGPSLEAVPSAAGRKEAFSNLPERNPLFIGREEVLTQLKEVLAAHGRAALSGLGGVGKTQIAAEYAHRRLDEYAYAFWATARSREALLSSYVTIASLLNLPESSTKEQTLAVGAVQRWLSSHPGWLLILDGADDLAMVREFIPPGQNGHVLLTTRAQAVGAIARRVEIQEMGTEEGALFLLRRARYIAEDAPLHAAAEIDQVRAKEITAQLDGLPLALDQAAAYIEETGCGLLKYRNLYQTHATELLQRRGMLAFDYHESVATIWALSFENIEKANPAAAELVRFCAFLHPDGIPEEVFSEGAPELGPVLGVLGSDALALDRAISDILKYSLLRRDSKAHTLEIHRLVQAVLKQTMDEATQRGWAERAVRAVNRAFPSVEFLNWPVCDRLLAQAQACAELINQWSFEFPEAARLLNKAGSYLYERGRYTDAEPLCQRALAIQEKALGPEHPDLADSLNNLAGLNHAQGQYANAEPLYKRALAIREKTLGSEHPDVATSLNGLAALYGDQGQYAKAEPLYKRALGIWEKALGPEYPEVATSLNGLAALYGDQGQYAKAQPLYEQALVIGEKALGPAHPAVARSLKNLAGLYHAQGQHAKAEPLYERALAIQERVLGPAHPEVATILNGLATLYGDQGQYAKAEPLYGRALAIREKALGQAHPENIAGQRIQVSARLGNSLVDLKGLGLKALPESIGQLTQLETLDLSENELTTLPDSIGRLTRLRGLYLGNNRLMELPTSLSRLPQLQILNVSGNELKMLPESISQLTQLETLDLSENELAALPGSIGQLLQLRLLNLGANSLRELPESLSKLSQLEILDLSKNQLSALPESIRKMGQLQFLGLAANELPQLPEWVGQLAQLQALDLRENQLTDLPGSLRQLSRLTQIYLHENDALGLPQQVLGPKLRDAGSPAKATEILEYYFRLRGGRRSLNEAKLILVGRGGVGKTSLVNRLVHDQFDDHERKTDGIRITIWKLRIHDKEDVQLNIWDFGGQEIMHATHQFFLTEGSLYLLVLSGREGSEDLDAEYWLQLIESFGTGSSVIVVLNKIREQPCDLNRRGLQQKYPSIRAFIKTDCQDKTGLHELRAAIEQETDRLEHLRDAFPVAWFSIKERLSGMKENYVSFERYRELCEKLGEKDPTAQEQLAGYLHGLGIALNFKDDYRLQDTHVLNPHWVTNGIYKILTADKMAEQHGVLRLRDLASILDPQIYPKSKHAFLLDLMKKFELCFEFSDDPSCRYLIPELLDKQEPDLGTTFKPDESLNFQYNYGILPEGLLPRFIVRTQILNTELRWRTGVVLEFEGNRALVKADIKERKVFILISGPVEGRRRLLAIIRSDFDRIHSDIKKLQPIEMVPIKGRPDAVIPYKELKVLEHNGQEKFHKVIDNAVVEIDVQDMLNGVDLEGSRGAFQDRGEGALVVFYSYSHEDETLRKKLETHLKLLQRQGLISTWHDRKISAGEEWKGKIDENLQAANIILLMVSAAFIASDYCYDLEMKRALERHHSQMARVIPVILRDVDWKSAPFGILQALPKDGKPVMLWQNRDSAWKDVAAGIRKVVEEIRDQTRSRSSRVSTRSLS